MLWHCTVTQWTGIIYHIRLSLFELCLSILPHWLRFSSYIRICSYVGICSDFFCIKDGKIIHHSVSDSNTLNWGAAVMQPLALKQLHNTNPPITLVVVTVRMEMRPQCLTACLQHPCLKVPSPPCLWTEKELMCTNAQPCTLTFQKTAVTDSQHKTSS